MHPEKDPLVEGENNRNNYQPNYRNRSRGRWNNHGLGDRSGNYPNYNRQGNMRPNYRQNTQWTFRNRSQNRNRNENMIMTILEVGVEIEIIGEEKNLGPNLTLG